jgi:hypothetical protein
VDDETLRYKAQGHNIRCFKNVKNEVVEEEQNSQQAEQASEDASE